MRQPRLLASRGREFTRGRIERCRNGDGDLLLRQRCLGVGLLPGPAQVLQVTGAGREGRDALDLRRCIGRQQRRAPIHAGVAQPALGAGHQTHGRGAAALACQFTHHAFVRRLAGQVALGRAHFAVVRQIKEGRQQRQRLHAGRCRELGHFQHALHHALAIAGR